MQQRLLIPSLTWLLVLLWAVPAGAQNKDAEKHSVCGVDIGNSKRCYDELKQLEQGCAKQPVICGHPLKRRGLAPLKSLHRTCVRMWRRRDKNWVRSLCGVALYSRPRTFCGTKGIEVALACSKQALVKAGVDLTALARPKPPAKRRSLSPAVGAVATRAAPRPAPTTPKVAPRAKPVAATTTAAVATKTPTSPWEGPLFWLLLLQMATLVGLVFFFRTSRQSTRRNPYGDAANDWDHTTWSPDSQWGSFDSRFSEGNQTSISEEMEDVLNPKMKEWGQLLETKVDSLRKTPLDDLEAQGREIYRYYLQLAEEMVKQVAPNNGTFTQRRLLEVQRKIEWIFSAHREPHGPVALVADLRHSLLSTPQSLLQQMGYLDMSEAVDERLRRGSFNFQEFLQRKRSDQVNAFLAKQPLQNFGEVCREYLQRLDLLYQNNLNELRDLCSSPATMPADQQERLYKGRFVEQFLMLELPQRLDALSRQSSPAHVGALLDRLAQFVEDCLKDEGLELYPRPQEEELESHVHSRIRFVRYAGVRDGEENVLRAPRFPSTPPAEVPGALSQRELVSAGVPESEQTGVSNSRIRAVNMVRNKTLAHGANKDVEMDSYPSLDAANDFRTSPPAPAPDAQGATQEYGRHEKNDLS